MGILQTLGGSSLNMGLLILSQGPLGPVAHLGPGPLGPGGPLAPGAHKGEERRGGIMGIGVEGIIEINTIGIIGEVGCKYHR